MICYYYHSRSLPPPSSFYLSLSLSIYLSISLSLSLSLSICMSVCMSVCLSVSISLCLLLSFRSRRVKKYFSYDAPLKPRAPTTDPLDMFSLQSTQDDSDSEINLTQAPKNKYVMSPTPNEEIRVHGFLGSNPGSGTFVYV